MSKLLCSFSLLWLLGACSHFSSLFPKAEKKKQAVELREETYGQLQGKLNNLMTLAKSSGEGSVKYLGSDMYLKASAASLRGDAQTAAFLFENLLTLYPKEGYLKTRFAVEVIRLNQFKKAQNLLEDLYFKEKSQDPKVGLLLGALYSALKKHDQALKVYKKLVKKHPSHLDACLLLAKEYVHKKGRDGLNAAVRTLRGCEKKDPTGSVISFYIGNFYLDFNKTAKAKSYFLKALKKNSNHPQATLGLGLIFEQEKKNKAAIKLYKKFLAGSPNNHLILSRLVQLLFAEGDYSDILPFAERLANLDQEDLNLKVRLGILYSDAGKFQKAITVFQEVLKEVPDSDKIHYYLGAIYHETKQYKLALDSYSKIGPDSSLFTDGNLQMAQLLMLMAVDMREKKPGLAKDYATKLARKIAEADDKAPELKPELLLVQANYYEAIGSLDLAIQTVKKIKNKKAEESRLYYLASLYEKNRQFLAAEQAIKKVLTLNPKNAHAMNFLGYTMLERGNDFKGALYWIKKAVALRPKDGYIRDSLGWYYFKRGKLEKALKELKIAVSQVGHDAVILKHLGMVYKALKKYDNARKYFKLSLQQVQEAHEKKLVESFLQDLPEERYPATSSP